MPSPMNSNNGPVPMNINKKPNKSSPMNINKKPKKSKKSKENGTHVVYVRAHTRIVKNKTQ